jgi:protein SCO1/2
MFVLRRGVFRCLWASLLVGLLSACDAGSTRFVNNDITGSGLTASFRLKDLQGQVRTLGSYRGKVVVMFFGYTHCPDVCPITLQQWAEVKSRLGEQGKHLQVIFVSVDPERDTPDLLSRYVPRFDPTFQALHGSEAELQPLLKGLKVLVSKVKTNEGQANESYLIDHTAASFVFDQQGKPRLLIRHQAAIAPVVKDLQALLSEVR